MKRVKIKSVSFRANVSNGTNRYENMHIEASTDIPAGEKPEAVLDQLKIFVAKELKRAKEGVVPPTPVGRFRV